MLDSTSKLLETISKASKNPRDQHSQDVLKGEIMGLVPNVAKFITELKRQKGLPPTQEQMVTNISSMLQSDLQKLMASIDKVDKADKTGADVSDALKDLDANQSQLEAAEFSAHSNLLFGTAAGQTREGSLELLQQFTDNLIPKVEALQRAANGVGPLGPASKEIAETSADVATAAEAVASTVSDKDGQVNILKSAKALNQNLARFVTSAKAVRSDKTNARSAELLIQVRNDVTKSLGDLLTSAKGVDMKEVDQSIKALRAEVANVKPVKTTSDFVTASKALEQRVQALNAASQQLVRTVKANPRRVGQNAKLITSTAKQLVAAANAAAGAADPETQNLIVSVSKSLFSDCADLLENGKTAAVTQQYDGLDRAAQKVGASVAVLEGITSGSSFPEVDEAINSIARELEGLDNIPEDMVAKSKKAIVKDLEIACGTLAGTIPRVSSAAAVGTDMVGIYAKETATAINSIISSAKSSKGKASSSSSSGSVDPRVLEFIKKCQEIMDNPASPTITGPAAIKINNLVKEITSNARETAMALASDKDRQTQYVNASKVLTTSVPKLVGYIKAGQPDLVSKCAEILSKTVTKIEAARTGLDENEMQGGDTNQNVDPVIQEKLITVARAVGEAATNFLRHSSQLAGEPLNQVLGGQITASSQSLMGAVNSLVTVARDLDPGKQEVYTTASELQKAMSDLDTATVNAGVGLLEKTKKSHQQLQKEFTELLNSFAPDVLVLTEKSGTSGDALVQVAKRIKSKIPELVDVSKDMASSDSNTNNSKKLLMQTKNFCNGLFALVNECYTGGERAEELGKTASDAIGELLGQLTESDQVFQELDQLVATVRKMVDMLAQPATGINRPYHEIKESVYEAARKLTSASVDLKTCDRDRVSTIGLQAKNMARALTKLLSFVKDAIAVTPEASTKDKIANSTRGLVESCADLIAASKLVAQQDSIINRGEFNSEFESFSESIRDLLNSVKKGALGETKIDDGVDNLSLVINKVNTSAIFASAGQSMEGVKKVNAPYEQQVAALVNVATKIKGIDFSDVANLTQDQLGQKIETFATVISTLTDSSLSAVDSCTSPEEQQNVIAATKAVAIAAKQLVLLAKDYQKTPTDNTAKATFENAKSSLPKALDTYIAILKGEQATVSFNRIEMLKKEFSQSFDSVEASTSATAVSVLESARAVAKAATPIILATSRDELFEAADLALRTVEDLLANVKGAAKSEPTISLELSDKAKSCASIVSKLLEVAKSNKNDDASQKALAATSSELNQQLESLVKSLNKMPGGSQLRLNSAVDLEGTTNRELSAAAALIKNAVASLPKGLATSKTSTQSITSNDILVTEEKLNESIVSSARVVAEATCRLLVAAQDAQQERGKTPTGKKYFDDPTWSNGLISASQKVAAGVSRLVNNASKASSGKLEEEELTVDAKYVASCVKQLVAASRVKEGISPSLQHEMIESSKDVTKATTEILTAAQKAADFKENKEITRGRKKTVLGVAGSIAQKLEAQTKVLRLEKQLEDARKQFLKHNQADYKKN